MAKTIEENEINTQFDTEGFSETIDDVTQAAGGVAAIGAAAEYSKEKLQELAQEQKNIAAINKQADELLDKVNKSKGKKTEFSVLKNNIAQLMELSKISAQMAGVEAILPNIPNIPSASKRNNFNENKYNNYKANHDGYTVFTDTGNKTLDDYFKKQERIIEKYLEQAAKASAAGYAETDDKVKVPQNIADKYIKKVAQLQSSDEWKAGFPAAWEMLEKEETKRQIKNGRYKAREAAGVVQKRIPLSDSEKQKYTQERSKLESQIEDLEMNVAGKSLEDIVTETQRLQHKINKIDDILKNGKEIRSARNIHKNTPTGVYGKVEREEEKQEKEKEKQEEAEQKKKTSKRRRKVKEAVSKVVEEEIPAEEMEQLLETANSLDKAKKINSLFSVNEQELQNNSLQMAAGSENVTIPISSLKFWNKMEDYSKKYLEKDVNTEKQSKTEPKEAVKEIKTLQDSLTGLENIDVSNISSVADVLKAIKDNAGTAAKEVKKLDEILKKTESIEAFKEAVEAENKIKIRQNKTQEELEKQNPKYFVEKELLKDETQKVINQETKNKIKSKYFEKSANKAQAQADWLKSPLHTAAEEAHIKSRNEWTGQTAIANITKQILGADFLAKEQIDKNKSLALKNEIAEQKVNANYVQIRTENMAAATELSKVRTVATDNKNRINEALGDNFIITNEQIKQNRNYYKAFKDKVNYENGIPALQVEKTKRQERTSKQLLSADKDFFVKSEQAKLYAKELDNAIENLKLENDYYKQQIEAIKKHNTVLNSLSDTFFKVNEEQKQVALTLKNRKEQTLLDNGYYDENVKSQQINNAIKDSLGVDFLADREKVKLNALTNSNAKNEYWLNNGGVDADIEAKKIANQIKGSNEYINTYIALEKARLESLEKQNELNEALGKEALIRERWAEILKKEAAAEEKRIHVDDMKTEEFKKTTSARRKTIIDNRAFDESIDLKNPNLREDARKAGYKHKITSAEAAEIRLEKLKSNVYGKGFWESIRKGLAGLEHRYTSSRGFVGVASRFTENLLKNKMTVGREVDASGKVIKAGTNFGGLVGAGIALTLEKLYKWAVQYGKEAMRAFGEIETLKTNLNVVYGSQSLANQTFNEISSYAVKSPFGVQQMTEFAILLKQSGVESVDLMNTLKQIGDVAGGNQEKFQRIANNYAQIIAANKATALDLRQFANAGLPIYQEIRKELGVSQKEVRDMTREGLIGAETIQKVFKNMTSKGGTFYNAVNQGAKTYKARMQNMADIKQLNFAEIGEWLYNANPLGFRESAFKSVLSILEDIYTELGGVATRANQNREIEYNEKYSKIYKKLLEKQGNDNKDSSVPDVKIEDVEDVYSSEQDRNTLATKFKNAKDEFDSLSKESAEVYKLRDKILFDSDISKEQRQFYRDLLKDKYKVDSYDFEGIVGGAPRYLFWNYKGIKSYDIQNRYFKLLKNENAKKAYNIVEGESLLSNSYSNVVNNSKQGNSAASLRDKYTELYKNTSYYKDEQEEKRLKEIENLRKAKYIEQKYGITAVNYNTTEDRVYNPNIHAVPGSTLTTPSSFSWIKEFYKSENMGNNFADFASMIKNQYSASDSALVLTPETLTKDKKEAIRTFSVLKQNVNLFSEIFDAMGDDIEKIDGGEEAFKIFKNYKKLITSGTYAYPEGLPVSVLEDTANYIGQYKEDIDKLSDDNPFKELFPLLFTELTHDSLKDVDIDKLKKNELPLWTKIMQKTLSIPEEVFNKGGLSTSSALDFATSMNGRTLATNFTQQMLSSGLRVNDIMKLMPLYHTADYYPNINEKYFGSDQKISRFFGVPDFNYLVQDADEADLTKRIPLNNLFGTDVTRFTKELGFKEDGATIYEFDEALNESIKGLSNFSDKLRDIRDFTPADAVRTYKNIALGFAETNNKNFNDKLNSGTLANQYATDLSNFANTLSTLLSQGMFNPEDNSILYNKESMETLGMKAGDIESFKKKFVALGFTFDEQSQSFKNATADTVQSLLDLTSNLSTTATTVATFKKEIDTNNAGKDKQDFVIASNKKYGSLFTKKYGIKEETLEEGFGTFYDSIKEQSSKEGYDNPSTFGSEILKMIASGEVTTFNHSREVSNEIETENSRKVAELNDRIEEFIEKNGAVRDWLEENGNSITINNVSDFIKEFGKKRLDNPIFEPTKFDLSDYSIIDTKGLELTNSEKANSIVEAATKFFESLYDKKSTDSSKDNKDILPFYKRLAGSIFGISNDALKNLNGTKGIFEYRNAANTRLSNEAIAKALIKYSGNFNFFKNQIQRDETYTGTGENKTQTVNQERTFNNLERLALSVNSNSSVTNAYSEQLKNQREQLENLMSAAAFRMEDSDKVTVKEVAEQLGYKTDDIEALEKLINAFAVSGNESLTTLLDRTYTYTRSLEVTTTALGSFKSLLETSDKNIAKQNFQINNIFASSEIPSDIYSSKMNEIYDLVESLDLAKEAGISVSEYITEAMKKEADANKNSIKLADNYEQFLKRQAELGAKLKDGKGDLSKEDDWEKYYKKVGEEKDGTYIYQKLNANADAIVAVIAEILKKAAEEATATEIQKNAESIKNFYDTWGVKRDPEKQKNNNWASYPENMSDKSTPVWRKVAGAFDFMNMFSYTDFDGNALTKYGQNSRDEQIAMNWLAANGDSSAENKDIRNWAAERMNTYNYDGLDANARNEAINNDKDSFLQIGEQLGIDDYATKVESVFEKVKNGSVDAKDAMAELAEEFGVAGAETTFIDKQFSELSGNIKSTAKSQALSAMNESFAQIGKNIAAGESASDGLYNIWKNMASTIMSSIGASMTSAGFDLISYGARKNKKNMITKGLLLAAAGGVAGIAGGILGYSDDSDTDNDNAEAQRIQNLKDALADLIDQAKTDAEYYQTNLMHKNALATNETISTRNYSVNDAIITPNGNVVSTHPDDYLIATKTPEQFIGGSSSGGVNLQVNAIVNNNSANVTATTETKENEDGSIDIITTIYDVVNNGLAEGKFDDGLASYDYRQQGRSVAS